VVAVICPAVYSCVTDNPREGDGIAIAVAKASERAGPGSGNPLNSSKSIVCNTLVNLDFLKDSPLTFVKKRV
jgi:hypothetical protein